jgi:hypothetical protein
MTEEEEKEKAPREKELYEPNLNPYVYPQEPGAPLRSSDKYLCPHCRAEVPVKQDCPGCGGKIDWSKI